MDEVYVYNGQSVNRIGEFQQNDHQWLQKAAERNVDHIYFYMDNGYPQVRRVKDGPRSSHIEPPMNPNWNNLEKLRHHAAVVMLATDLKIRVNQTGGGYNIQVNSTSSSSQCYEDAWLFLSGVETGAITAKNNQLLGMVWYLAHRLDNELPHQGTGTLKELVEDAKKNFEFGLTIKEKA